MERFQLKRIYEPFKPEDGHRVLIDRLWPRGISKEHAHLADWAKDVAPSSELRKWFDHDPDKFLVFQEKYVNELRTDAVKTNKVSELRQLASTTPITLVFAAKDPIQNHAVILKEELERNISDAGLDL
ncbi:DUF488 domain-containing protein [Sporosarcina beigongshangi]|uniref:DUF488 domain-containing protein n=1 Tax=Sporosarcina beigongshangi TaxID=2782538 RepID=UPI0019399A8C|nr:DUF488 family protein [Sporosarcina beigongshangi]